MTAEKAGKKWGYSDSQIKRLTQLCSSIPDRFPRLSGHITIPDDSPKIFLPDKRSKNSRGYFYRYIFDAIGTDSLLYPESIGISDTDLSAHLRALLENHEIERKDICSSSWNTTDFMIPRNGTWCKKTSVEKRQYLKELIEKISIGKNK